MAEDAEPVIGMSIGATTLAAVTTERAVTREPVLTMFGDGSSRIGVPAGSPADSENGESGLVFTGFVDHVGDSAPVVAADGSASPGEQLLADGLHALARVAAGGDTPPPAALTHPAHWPATAVYALHTALEQVPEWSRPPVPLISDVAAALTALQDNPGLPAAGIIAVCDFGGSGTSITLVDAASGHQTVGATVRDTDFSGERIDQALLDYVMADLRADDSPDGESANASPAVRRGQCRTAKEQLSVNTVTELKVDLPGFHGGVWVTRAELDEAIRQPLDGFLDTLQETLHRNKIPAAELAAVAAVGGGASIPAITDGLSRRFSVEVISPPRPHLTAAIGAALEAARRPATPPAKAPPPPPTDDQSASVWPRVEHSAGFAPLGDDAFPKFPDVVSTPPAAAQELAADNGGRGRRVTWNRGQMPLLVGVALAVLIAGAVAVVALRHASAGEPATPAPSVSPAPPSTTVESPAPGMRTAPMPTTAQPPVPGVRTAPMPTTAESPVPESPVSELPVPEVSTAPTVTVSEPPAEPPVAPVPAPQPAYPEIPGIPPVPEAPGPAPAP